MALIADVLLLAAALTAAVYCHVLAGRLKRLRSLDGGVGQAVAAMSAQVEEMRAALRAAKAASGESTRTLAERTARAEMAAGRLELLLAALHDREGATPLDLGSRRPAPRAPAPGRGPDRPAPARAQSASAAALSPGAAPGADQAPAAEPASDDAPPPESEPPEPAGAEAPPASEAVSEPPQADAEEDAAPGRRLFRIRGRQAEDGEARSLRDALQALARESSE
ncbi:MAG: hypothetical protein ACQEUZ_13610 [Pseudomonadota bacterium]